MLSDEELFSVLKEKRLLCVEDDPDTAEQLPFLMGEYFGNVYIAGNGLEALERFKKGDIDAIITDLRMPGMDGLALIKQIRRLDEDVPIVLMTGFDERDTLTEAINLGVNGFLSKPIKIEDIEKVFKKIARSLLLEKLLHEREEYRLMQETMGISKELHLLRNDYYYQAMDDACHKLINFIYAPRDGLSGDAYSMRRMSNGNIFLLLVDGMGKGLSASLTAMMLTGYVNHRIDQMNRTRQCEMTALLEDSLAFLRSILLPEESVSLSFICIDAKRPIMRYATFAMPAILLLKNEGGRIQVHKYPSNNPPASCYTKHFRISQLDLNGTIKFLAYSDGLSENSTKEGGIYNKYLIEDFQSVLTRNEMKELFEQRIVKQEDDVTMIQYVDVGPLLQDCETKRFHFSTERYDEEILPWYEAVLKREGMGDKEINRASMVLTELVLNAYEHGNLGITSEQKDRLIASGEYDEFLEKRSAECKKRIGISLCRLQFGDYDYMFVMIEDEGKGFDTQLLRDLFFKRNRRNNGRGVVLSQKNTLGIFYNGVGNRVVYLLKIDR